MNPTKLKKTITDTKDNLIEIITLNTMFLLMIMMK